MTLIGRAGLNAAGAGAATRRQSLPRTAAGARPGGGCGLTDRFRRHGHGRLPATRRTAGGAPGRRAQRPAHAGRAQPEVQPRTHPRDVEVVVAELVPRMEGVAAPPLGKPGDPRTHPQPALESRHRPADPRRQRRTLGSRPDQAHLAPQHVDDLRQLVEMVPAQHPADRGAARIAPHRPHRSGTLLGVLGHGAELEHPEHPSVPSQPRLAVEHGTSALDAERQRDCAPEHHPQRPQQHQRERHQSEIERALVAFAARYRPLPAAPARRLHPRSAGRRGDPVAGRAWAAGSADGFPVARTWARCLRPLHRAGSPAPSRPFSPASGAGAGHSTEALHCPGNRQALMR